jgi:tRNA (guanine-N7-)-methyltransferase
MLITREPFRTPSFTRRVGKTLRYQQKIYVKDLLPKVQMTEEFDFAAALKNYDNAILEIGFGNGEHLAHFASANPNTLCIGAEPFINGIATLLKSISENNLSNILVYKDDVRNLFTKIPPKYLEKVYIICPDPWPKQRQLKRRLINSEFLKTLATLTKKEIVIATDHLGYAQWILQHALDAKFTMPSENLEHYKTLPDGWIYTKYQRRGIKHGSDIYYFVLKTN